MHRAGALRSKVAALGAATVIFVSACGGSTPSGAATSGPPAASGAVPASGSIGQADLIEFADTGDPTAAAHRELDLVHEMRDEAGMPALIGASGSAAFTALDGIEASFGQKVLADVSASIASAGIPVRASIDPLAGQLAATGGAPRPGRVDPAAIDVSLFADTGFTANAIMSLYTGLVERAAQSQTGTLPKQEHYSQTADGLRQEVDLNTTMTIKTGGGRVSADITMTATDNIFDAANGSFVALYTSTAHGHFDVNACPDVDGIGAGTYTFETKHELNDVSTSSAARSGAGRSVEAPFQLINGDDAHLVRIEASLDLSADANGPGTAGGPGPTAPFDWGASQQIQLVMPAKGGTTQTGGGAAVTGSGGERAGGALFISSAMAQLFLAEVGKEAETFWRSGECIELKPSDDTRKVQPSEKIELKVEAKHKFDGQQVKAPIVAKFTGTKSIEPADTPVDAPAKFTFTAGKEKDDKGTIDLKQTSKRGIGLRQIVFTVGLEPLQASVEAVAHLDSGGNVYDTKIHLKPFDLAPAQDGSQKGTATVTWTTTYTSPGNVCKPKTYTGEFKTEVVATPDPEDPTRVLFKASFIPGQVKHETLVCQGRSFPFPGGTNLGGWAYLGQPHAVTLGQPTDITLPGGTGTSKATVTIKKKASS